MRRASKTAKYELEEKLFMMFKNKKETDQQGQQQCKILF